MRTRLSALLGLACLGALAASARAEVDVEVPVNFKAKGTLSQPGEEDHYRFFATRGTVFTLTAAPLAKADLALTATLLEEDGDPAAVLGGTLTTTGGKVVFKSFSFQTTGRYRIVLSGVGTGDYSLSLKGKPQASWKTTVAMAGTPSYDLFQFPAYPGSTVTVLVKAARGSAAVPRLQTLYDTTEAYSVDLSAAGKTTPTSHAATQADVQPGINELVQDFQNTGAAGDVDVLVKVKPPRTKPGKLDLRGSVLGRPSGGETLVGRVLGTDGGTVEAEDAGGDLYGAAVTFASDALAGPTLVTLASSPPPPIADPDDQAAGPAVRLGPSGVIFESPAVVTLPVDPSKIPADATIDDVRILITEDDGSSRIELPSGVAGNSVTVETTTFSVCIPIIVSGPPPLGISPGGDEFWFLQFSAQFFAGTIDSRGRSISANIGECSFFGDGTFQFSQEAWGYTWQNQDSPPMSGLPIDSGLTQFTQGDGATLTWAYDVSGRNIVLSGAPMTLPTFRISRDGRYIAGRHDASTDPQAETQIGVRKNTAPLTVASLKGTWSAAYLEVDAGSDSSTGAAEQKTSRGTATFVFDGVGGCKVNFTERKPNFDSSDSTFDHQLFNGSLPNATYSVDVDGTVLITSPPPEGDDGDITLRAYPGAGLEVMLLTHTVFVNDSAMGMVLVRQGNDLSKASLNGAFHGTAFGVDPQSYVTPTQGGVPIGDFAGRDEGVTAAFDGGATASVSFDHHEVQRDTWDVDGVSKSNGVENITVNVTVTSQGKFSIGDGQGKVVGAISPDAQFLVAVNDVTDPGQDYTILFAFRAPPDKTP